jgi:hypothetical protein
MLRQFGEEWVSKIPGAMVTTEFQTSQFARHGSAIEMVAPFDAE